PRSPPTRRSPTTRTPARTGSTGAHRGTIPSRICTRSRAPCTPSRSLIWCPCPAPPPPSRPAGTDEKRSMTRRSEHAQASRRSTLGGPMPSRAARSPFAPAIALIAAASLSLIAPKARALDFTVSVDARDVARGMLHVTQTFPARSGTLSLSYPRWIPGEHGPTGPNVDVAGLVIRARGKVLPWQRDLADMQTVRVAVPGGPTEVEVTFDFLLNNS